MSFLLSNDDGIDAIGLKTLHDLCRHLGEVVVVAPFEESSGLSHQATNDRPVRMSEIAPDWHGVDGTPVDCARIGLKEFGQRIRWVLSGINYGANLGVDVFQSGTVAVVREAALRGANGAAISQYWDGENEIDWLACRRMVSTVLECVLDTATTEGSYWNINLPVIHGDAETPDIVECPVDLQPRQVENSGGNIGEYCLTEYGSRPREAGTDVDVCLSGKIAISRIHLGADQKWLA